MCLDTGDREEEEDEEEEDEDKTAGPHRLQHSIISPPPPFCAGVWHGRPPPKPRVSVRTLGRLNVPTASARQA